MHDIELAKYSFLCLESEVYHLTGILNHHNISSVAHTSSDRCFTAFLSVPWLLLMALRECLRAHWELWCWASRGQIGGAVSEGSEGELLLTLTISA